MAPKVKITQADIVEAALGIIRVCGIQAVNARALAASLNCSTQPIFSNFASMDELRIAVSEKAAALFDGCMKREAESGEYPAYKASGMAYIRFAKEEPELFKLLFMSDSSEAPVPDSADLNGKMSAVVQDITGLEIEAARLFHLEMWAFVHGIAVMLATGFYNLERDHISKMISDVYQGLRKQYETEQ